MGWDNYYFINFSFKYFNCGFYFNLFFYVQRDKLIFFQTDNKIFFLSYTLKIKVVEFLNFDCAQVKFNLIKIQLFFKNNWIKESLSNIRK